MSTKFDAYNLLEQIASPAVPILLPASFVPPVTNGRSIASEAVPPVDPTQGKAGSVVRQDQWARAYQQFEESRRKRAAACIRLHTQLAKLVSGGASNQDILSSSAFIKQVVKHLLEE
jgi:hypothetical protein